MRVPYHPATEEIELSTVMHALSDPVRLEIVARLTQGTKECGPIGADMDLHKSTMSHHYRVLREAGVTQTTVAGRARHIDLRRDDLEARFPGLLDSVLGAIAASA